jgi:hypothetical protein
MLISRRQKVWKSGLTVERRRDMIVVKLEEESWSSGDGNEWRCGIFCVHDYEPVNSGEDYEALGSHC